MATRKKKGTPQKDVRRKKVKEEAVKRPLTKLERQLRVLDPSIPMALYLTLLNHEEVAYLREDYLVSYFCLFNNNCCMPICP